MLGAAGLGRAKARRYGTDGVLAGGRRWFAACSKAYASRISVGSDQARPRNVMPDGNSPRTKPIGTVIAGNPVRGDNVWLLSPAGVLRSPISRGGLSHVGYTTAAILASSMTL